MYISSIFLNAELKSMFERLFYPAQDARCLVYFVKAYEDSLPAFINLIKSYFLKHITLFAILVWKPEKCCEEIVNVLKSSQLQRLVHHSVCC